MSMYHVFFPTETEDMMLALCLLYNTTPDDLLSNIIEEQVLQLALRHGLKRIGHAHTVQGEPEQSGVSSPAPPIRD